MSITHLPYGEGAWFAIPLAGGTRWATGLVARAGESGGILFGYFFGPARERALSLADTADLKAEDATMLALFSDTALVKGEWPVVGAHPAWQRARWPMPTFRWDDHALRQVSLVEHSEDMPVTEVSIARVEPGEAAGHPPNTVLGCADVEASLGRLLRAD